MTDEAYASITSQHNKLLQLSGEADRLASLETLFELPPSATACVADMRCVVCRPRLSTTLLHSGTLTARRPGLRRHMHCSSYAPPVPPRATLCWVPRP